MAEAIGAVPVRLAPGSKAAYHAAAVLAAGGVVALLDAIRELAARSSASTRPARSRIYLPLVEQTVANARSTGRRGGAHRPAVRGRRGHASSAHLRALGAGAPGALPVYRALVARSVDIALARGSLSPEGAERIRTALAGGP